MTASARVRNSRAFSKVTFSMSPQMRDQIPHDRQPVQTDRAPPPAALLRTRRLASSGNCSDAIVLSVGHPMLRQVGGVPLLNLHIALEDRTCRLLLPEGVAKLSEREARRRIGSRLVGFCVRLCDSLSDRERDFFARAVKLQGCASNRNSISPCRAFRILEHYRSRSDCPLGLPWSGRCRCLA